MSVLVFTLYNSGSKKSVQSLDSLYIFVKFDAGGRGGQREEGRSLNCRSEPRGGAA